MINLKSILKTKSWILLPIVSIVFYRLSMYLFLNSVHTEIEDDVCGEQIYGQRIYQVVDCLWMNKLSYVCEYLAWFCIICSLFIAVKVLLKWEPVRQRIDSVLHKDKHEDVY